MRAAVTLLMVLGLIPIGAHASPANGDWGLYAAAQGRTVDLDRPSAAWSEDPDLRRGDIEAGYGIRKARMSAVFGYGQRDFGATQYPRPELMARDEASPHHDSSGALGFSFAFHPH